MFENFDFEVKKYLFTFNLKEAKNKKYNAGDCDEHIAYIFDSYEEFKSYFAQNGVDNIKDGILKLCILKTTTKGKIISIKKICDYTITRAIINRVKNDYVEQEKKEIHERGKITPLEKVSEWEKMNLCAPKNRIKKINNRCSYFEDCHECLIHYSATQKEYEPLESKKICKSADDNDISKVKKNIKNCF